MAEIQYTKGDAIQVAKQTLAQSRHVLLPHVCNNQNRWGAGFTRALSREWRPGLHRCAPEVVYLFRQKEGSILGTVQYCPVLYRGGNTLTVVNMVAQAGVRGRHNQHPLCYPALDMCMRDIAGCAAQVNECHIVAPMFGAGLAGGDWSIIEGMITEIWCPVVQQVTIVTWTP